MERKRTKNNKPINKTSDLEDKFSMIEKDRIPKPGAGHYILV